MLSEKKPLIDLGRPVCAACYGGNKVASPSVGVFERPQQQLTCATSLSVLLSLLLWFEQNRIRYCPWRAPEGINEGICDRES